MKATAGGTRLSRSRSKSAASAATACRLMSIGGIHRQQSTGPCGELALREPFTVLRLLRLLPIVGGDVVEGPPARG